MKVWCDLNPDLLLSIAKYTTTKDHIVLRAVCKSWCSILLDDNYYISAATLSNQQLPWGLFPCRRLGHDDGRCLLYSLSEKQQYFIDLPEFYRYRCCGSSHGWLIFSDYSPAMFMINPLTKQRIELPPITTILARGSFIEYDESNIGKEYCYTVGDGRKIRCVSERMKRHCISKVILTGNPSFDKVEDYLIIVLSSENGYIGICRAGDDRWTSVDMDSSICMVDIVYWNGSLYGISQFGVLIKWDDLQNSTPTMKLIACSKVWGLTVSDFAITEASSSPNFLVVYRKHSRFPEDEEEEIFNSNACFCRGCYRNDDDSDSYDDCDIFTDSDDNSDQEEDDDHSYEDSSEEDDVVDEGESEYSSSEEEEDEKYFWRTDKLVVYMFNEEQQKWIRVWDIGDHALFLGTNSSMAIPTQDFPDCKPNHIYFSHGDDDLGCKENDTGVMNIKNNKRQSFSGCSKLSSNLPKPFVPSFVWFIPSL